MPNRMLALTISSLVLASAPAVAQPAVKNAPETNQQKWVTSWGDPDLEGTWSNATTTPLERPAKYQGRQFLTPAERDAIDTDTAIATDKRAKRGSVEDVEGAYNGAWWERGRSDGRTSLIYDPADGRIPPLTPDGEKRKQERARLDRTDENYSGHGRYAGPEELDVYTRCIVRAPLPRISTGYDNNYQIVQAPGFVAIMQEQIHETRIIPLDGQPHLNQGVRQWLGDSRGHWEGDTLVVETTNFSDQTSFQGATKNMVLVERWRRTADDKIDYRFTVSDPQTWTRPWSAAITWYKTGALYEYACHEDNYGLYGILAGARAKEKATAQAQPGKQ